MESTVPPQIPQKKSLIKKVLTYGLPVVLLLIVLLIFFKPLSNKHAVSDHGDAEDQATGDAEVAIVDTIKHMSVFDPEPGPAPHTLTPEELRQNLEHEIAIADEPYYEPEAAMVQGDLHPKTVRYIYWAQLVAAAKATNQPVMISLAKNLEEKLHGNQLKEFPRMRKRYAEIITTTLSHSNVNVEVHGSRNDELYFISSAFNDQNYVRDFHNSLIGFVRQYRFQETRYFTQPGVEVYRLQTGSQSDDETYESFR